MMDSQTPVEKIVNYITVAEIKREGWDSSNILNCRVEYVIPPSPYVKKDGSPGMRYRFVFSDGQSTLMDVIAFGYYGSKVALQLKENCCYSIRGEIQAEIRNKNFLSESNSNFYLKLGQVNIHPVDMKPFGRISLTELTRKMLNEDRILVRLHKVVFVSGCLYVYKGCPICNASLKDPSEDGKFYCSSKSKLCAKTQKTPRERKELIIIHSVILRDPETNTELFDVVIFDSLCRKLLTVPENQTGDLSAFQDIAGCSLYIRIAVERAPTGFSKPRIESIINVTPPELNPSEDSEDDYDNQPSDEDTDSSDDIPELLPFRYVSPTTDLEQRNDLDECIPRYVRDQDKPKGLVLLVNNREFPTSIGPPKTRSGSEKDMANIKETFSTLNYKIFQDGHEQISAEELDSLIEQFKIELTTHDYSSLFVIIMSHGNNNAIRMTKDTSINIWTDVVYKFGDETFQEFKGKPKMFFVNTCQSFTKREAHPTHLDGPFRDILVSFPCLPGFRAKRRIEEGMWFIHFFLETLREHCTNLDLASILYKVQTKLDKRSVEETQKYLRHEDKPNFQCSTWVPCLFKKYYFT